MKLSRSIKIALAYKERSDKEIAEKLGVSRSFFSMLKHGRKRPSLEVLERMSAEFGYKLSEFIALGED